MWAQIIGGVIGGVGAAYNIRKNNKKLAKAYLDQSKKMVKEYNYNIGALDNQQQSAFDSARVELFNLSVVGSKNISMVKTALGESGLEGRSHTQVEREVSGVLGMQKSSVQEAYQDVAKDLKVKRNNLYIQTNEALESAYKTMKSQQTSVMDALLFKIPQGVSQGMALAKGMTGDDSAVYGTEGRQAVTDIYANNGNINLYSYSSSGYGGFGGYSYNMGYGSAGPSAYNFQTGRWG